MFWKVKNDNARSAEAMQAGKVRELQGKIVDEEHEHRKLEDEIYNFKSKLATQVTESNCVSLFPSLARVQYSIFLFFISMSSTAYL